MNEDTPAVPVKIEAMFSALCDAFKFARSAIRAGFVEAWTAERTALRQAQGERLLPNDDGQNSLEMPDGEGLVIDADGVALLASSPVPR